MSGVVDVRDSLGLVDSASKRQAMVLATRAEDLRSTPGTHMVEGENLLPQVVHRPLPELWPACTHTHRL